MYKAKRSTTNWGIEKWLMSAPVVSKHIWRYSTTVFGKFFFLSLPSHAFTNHAPQHKISAFNAYDYCVVTDLL